MPGQANNLAWLGLDEAPQAYKNIEDVMRSLKKLVVTVGTFTPRIVRMDG
ncbi:MAG: RtcB family protein [Bacteroidetes bacterium]|nr:RtcB family protein [Bacteroidota bacterium]